MYVLNAKTTVEKFFSWQQSSILGECNINFVCKNKPKQLIDILQKKIALNKKNKNYRRSLSIKMIEENDSRSIIIKKKSNMLWSTGYFFEGNIFGKEGNSFIFGKYRMDIYYKIFFLIWFNSALLFFAILLLLTIRDILKYTLLNQNYGSLTNNITGILLSMLVIISGYILVSIIRYIDKSKYISDFFESLNIKKVDSGTIGEISNTP